MLDEGVCLLCGNPVAANATYCSLECSAIDSSSSASASVSSATSSAQPSPMLQPSDNGHHSDVPPLVRTHHRNALSMSSTSTVDSEEYVYGGDKHSRLAAINYSRRPSATNQRSTIPTIPQHRRASSNTSTSSGLELSHANLYRRDSAYMLAKALDNFPVFSNHHLESTSSSAGSSFSDEEYPGFTKYGTITDRSRRNAVPIRIASSPTAKKHHRVSLPAYFSRLTVGVSPPPAQSHIHAVRSGDEVSEYDTPIQHTQAHSYPSPKSNPSSGAKISSTITRGIETTPRGRGRERGVRQGASRSSQRGGRMQSQRSWSRPFSRSPSLTSSPLSQDKTTITNSNSNSTIPISSLQQRRLSDPHTAQPRPALGFGLGYARSLGERAIRVPEHFNETQQNNITTTTTTTEQNALPRGRRARGEIEPVREGERGRSRLVVRRGGSPYPHGDAPLFPGTAIQAT